MTSTSLVRWGWGIALGPAAVWGAVAAWWTPRGPLTSAEALWSMVISAAVGAGAGGVARSRRAILLTPLTYALVLEVARLRVSGPTVDAPHASAFGVIALLTGRGVHGLLSLLPMAVGVALVLPRRARTGRGPRGRPRPVLSHAVPGLATVLVLGIAALVAIPARTAAIHGGVAELVTVDGLRVMIRGVSESRPVLLFVPGTPGGSEIGAMRKRLSGLEQDFVVATLDRRGGGGSAAALDPTSRVDVDGGVADILAVTDHLRARFGRARIYLLGFSGGSVLGALAAHRAPEKFAAYIGAGQAVDPRASDQLFYADILAWARSGGRDEVVARLVEQGPPPYGEFWSYEVFLMHENAAYGQEPPSFDVDVSEYTMVQRAHTLSTVMDTWSVLYPRMQDVDLRRDVPRLAIPAYFVQGANEMRGLSVLFDEWYAAVESPDKRLRVIPGAGHRVMFEQPAQFTAVLRDLLPA